MSEREEHTPSMEDLRADYASEWGGVWRGYVYSTEREAAFDRAIAAHDRKLRQQIERDIEQYYLGPESGRFFDGRDAPDAAEVEAFDDGLQLAASIARGEEQTDE